MNKLLIFFVLAVSSLAAFASGSVKELTEAQTTAVLSKAKRTYVIDFNATWCGPCRLFKPVFDETAGELKKVADFYSVDVDKCPVFSRSKSIKVVPTVYIYNPKTKKSKTFTGVVSKDDLVAAIKLINSDK